MAETKMPAAEADERSSYEFAFHVLPTVAEGEVPGVYEELKTLITKHDGEIFSEEAPERIDLAYEIVKATDGKNRKYNSAYFGWTRFRVAAEQIEKLQEEIDVVQSILRYFIVKLTKIEEENPFRYHENRKADTKISEIVEEDILADPIAVGEGQSKEVEAKSEEAEASKDDLKEEEK